MLWCQQLLTGSSISTGRSSSSAASIVSTSETAGSKNCQDDGVRYGRLSSSTVWSTDPYDVPQKIESESPIYCYTCITACYGGPRSFVDLFSDGFQGNLSPIEDQSFKDPAHLAADSNCWKNANKRRRQWLVKPSLPLCRMWAGLIFPVRHILSTVMGHVSSSIYSVFWSWDQTA